MEDNKKDQDFKYQFVGNSHHLNDNELVPKVDNNQYFTESLCFPFSKVENLIDTPLQSISAINISKENKSLIEDSNITDQLKEDEIKLKVKESSNNFDNDNHIKLQNKKEEEDYCNICLGSLTNTIHLFCSHKFCSLCLIDYITSKINIKDVDRIVCPQYNCNRLFSHKDILIILSEYEKSQKEICKLFLKKLKEKELTQSSVHLKCPFPDCDSYSLEQDWKSSKFKTCTENHSFCFICNKNQESHLKESGDCIYTEGIEIGNSEVCHFCGFIQLKSNQNVFMECESCRILYCLLCKRYSTNVYNHYRAFTPCFKLKNCKKNSILARSFFLRCLRLFIIIIVFIIMLPFLVVFGSTIFFIVFNRKYFYKLFEEDPMKIKLTLMVIYSFSLGIIFYFLISLMLVSVGSLYFAGEFIPMVLKDYFDYFSNTKQSIKNKWNINLIVNERDGSNTVQKIDKLLIKYF